MTGRWRDMWGRLIDWLGLNEPVAREPCARWVPKIPGHICPDCDLEHHPRKGPF